MYQKVHAKVKRTQSLCQPSPPKKGNYSNQKVQSKTALQADLPYKYLQRSKCKPQLINWACRSNEELLCWRRNLIPEPRENSFGPFPQDGVVWYAKSISFHFQA